MDIRRTELTGLEQLGAIWKDTPTAELEGMITDLDLTGWQDVIQYLRSLGMRDAPQTVKLNICLSNDIRITLTGAGVIQAYCKDNMLKGKPFVAMIKETIADANPVDLPAYGARVKLKREIPLTEKDPRLIEVLANWDKLAKHFRNIQRFEFVPPGGVPLRFDVSLVRENADRRPARTFQEARITVQPPKYEVEAEVTAIRARTSASQAAALVVRGLGWLLQGRQRSFVLVSKVGSAAVLESLGSIFGPSGGRGGRGNSGNAGRNNSGRNGSQPFRYPGPQPATLERINLAEGIDAEPSVPNIRAGYNVTDKADGLRCLLYVAENGRIFLVDGGGRVYGTGLQVDRSAAGLVLDGEWIKKNKKGDSVSHYYGFDILAGPRGDTSVAQLPFMIEGAMLGAAAAENSRHAVLSSTVKMLGAMLEAGEPYVRNIPAPFQMQIGMKTFRTGANIFRDAIQPMLDDALAAPYATDGLIFTPNAAPLPLNAGGTWPAQLKWKPPHENTIDFLIAFEKEKGGSLDLVGTKFREDSGQTVRYKTMRLFVGSARDAAFSDPRATVLGGEPLPTSLDEGEYRPVEFRPMEPRDPMASTCYIAIGESASDPAAATRAATVLDPGAAEARATRTGDILQNNMIVEMAYHPERSPGWRWEPVRVRFDKTERFAAGQKRGTMNADWVASSIWSSLHNPVTADMIRSGTVIACLAPSAAVAPSTYYNRRAPARDMMKVQCLRNFHNDVVKRDILLRKTVRPGAALCDLAMGKAGDLHKWISAGVSRVFGCDIAAANLNDPEDGAYRRLLDKMVSSGGRDRVPPMTFVQADASKRLSDGTAGITEEDRAILTSTFRGPAEFDVVSCMFATHYMFRDEATLSGFLTNLADTVKVGGHFVGCGFDGDAVARLLAAEPTAVGQDGATDVWAITKRYGAAIGSSVPPSSAGLGLTVDVDFISIGDTHPEYLVSFPYLQSRLAEVGLELLTPSELLERGLPASSQMFGDTWAAATAAGKPYNMSDAEKRISFLNRWYVFVRRSDRRPAPSSLVSASAAVSAPADFSVSAPASAAAAASAAPYEGGGVAESKGGEEVALDVIELEPAAAADESKEYRIDANNVTPDLRLGPELSDWPRYLSMGTLVEIPDLKDPAIRYPSLEAAIASAKYQRATDKPEMGPKLFVVGGLVDKKYREARIAAVDRGDQVALRKAVDDQVALTRQVSGKEKIKATWNQGAWNAARDEVYQAYLTERLRADGRFRAILEAIKAKEGTILFVNGVEPSELGVGVRVDGSLVGGDNLVGRWMMSLV